MNEQEASTTNKSPSLIPLQQRPSSDVEVPHNPGASSPQRAEQQETSDVQSQLDGFFMNGDHDRSVYSNQEIQIISQLLGASYPVTQIPPSRRLWSQVPRLYIVLRVIGQLQSLDTIVKNGFTDVGFPFTSATVPKGFNVAWQADFLKKQSLVLSRVEDVVDNKLKKHMYLDRKDFSPYEAKENLGRGSYGTVDRVYCVRSHRDLARKRIERGHGTELGGFRTFEIELQALKRVRHRHCVELIESYTDQESFGLLMLPIADCNLKDFYQLFQPDKVPILRGFYGCLAAALDHLHSLNIRHRDIKPSNVLVKDDTVYLTDFGISHVWEDLESSTTMDDGGKSPLYCPPEMMRGEPRNRSADVWSLGCVFFEMATILHGNSIESMRSFFEEENGSLYYFANIAGARKWAQRLKEKTPGLDGVAFEWALDMMKNDYTVRPSAGAMSTRILSTSQHEGNPAPRFVSECCLPSHDEACSQEKFITSDDNTQNQPSEDPSTPRERSDWIHGEDKLEVVTNMGLSRSKDTLLESDELPPSYSQLFPRGKSTQNDIESTVVPQSAIQQSGSEHFITMSQVLDPLPQMVEHFSQPEFPPPNLSRESWDSPLDLLEAIRSDHVFMENLAVKDSSYSDLIRKCTVNDLTRLLDCFIQNGLDPANVGDASGTNNTALVAVVVWGSNFDRLFQILVDQRFDATGLESSYPLYAACRAGNIFAVNLLLDRGIDVNQPTDRDLNLAKDVPLSIAVKEEQLEVFQLLLSRGANPDGINGNPLFFACEKGNLAMINVLLDAGARLHQLTRHDQFYGNVGPALVATEANQLETLKLLIARGVHPDTVTDRGVTPLICACFEGHTAIVRYLLDNHKKRLNLYARFDCTEAAGHALDFNALSAAAAQGRLEAVEVLLDHGVEPDRKRNFMTGAWTPLHHAAVRGNIDIVHLLLTRGANVVARSVPVFTGHVLGHTPYSMAKKEGHDDVAKLLASKEKETLLDAKSWNMLRNMALAYE